MHMGMMFRSFQGHYIPQALHEVYAKGQQILAVGAPAMEQNQTTRSGLAPP